MRFRVAVAIKTPLHRERFFLLDDFHLVDATVTGHATDSPSDMSCVIEVHEVRQVVNAFPLNWFVVVFEAGANRFQQGAVVMYDSQIATGLP